MPLSPNLDCKSLWSRQPFDQLFGVAQNLGMGPVKELCKKLFLIQIQRSSYSRLLSIVSQNSWNIWFEIENQNLHDTLWIYLFLLINI